MNVPHRDNKLSARVMKCMYLGLPSESRGFRLLNVDTHCVLFSRDNVRFIEDAFPAIKSVVDVAQLRVADPKRNCFTVDPVSVSHLPPLSDVLRDVQSTTV